MWFLCGIVLEVLSTLSGTAGKQLIRLSELQERHKAFRSARVTFITGILINTVAGPLLDMAAYSFAAQSLIAPFGGLDVVWNAALAPSILKEKLTRTRLVSCALIVFGTVSSSLFGSHSDREYNVDILLDLLITKRVAIYLTALLVFVCLMGIPMRCPKGHILRGVSLGVTAGVIAGNMFCLKAAVELVQSSFRGDDDAWSHWLPYVVILGAIFFALSNLVFMTKGMLEYEALFMVTFYEGTMIVSNCLSANVILLEGNDLETWRLVAYCLCIFVVVLGMLAISIGEATGPVSQEQENRQQIIGVLDSDMAGISLYGEGQLSYESDEGKGDLEATAFGDFDPHPAEILQTEPTCSGECRRDSESEETLKSVVALSAC